jgi:hypothetical protein
MKREGGIMKRRREMVCLGRLTRLPGYRTIEVPLQPDVGMWSVDAVNTDRVSVGQR